MSVTFNEMDEILQKIIVVSIKNEPIKSILDLVKSGQCQILQIRLHEKIK